MGLLSGTSLGSGLIQFASDVVSAAPTTFDFQVLTTAANQTYSWNILTGTGINASTDWGDGTVTTHTTAGTYTNTYAAAGIYTVKIGISSVTNGVVTFRPNADRTRLRTLLSGFPAWTGVTNLGSAFNGCTGLIGTIPTDLLRYVTNLTNLSNFFNGCNNVTGSIPTDLLRYVPNVTTVQSMFQSCSGITGSIPTDLLRYVPNVTNLQNMFQSCSGITGSIPADLLRYVTSATNLSNMLNACTNLSGSIPADLLRYVTSATTLFNVFAACPNLTGTIPVDFLRYVTNVTDFSGLLNGCGRLQLQPDIFGPTPTTRFLNQSVNFTTAFRGVGTTAGIPQGTAPEMWTLNFGTGTPTTTNCFQLGSATTLSNWTSIPTIWAGPGVSTPADGLDTDVSAFFYVLENAGDTALASEKTMINDLVLSLKANGTWTKFSMIWFPVGSSLASARRALKHPTGAGLQMANAGSTQYVSGDWNRNVGLNGSSADKRLNSAVLDNVISRTDNHLSIMIENDITGVSYREIGTAAAASSAFEILLRTAGPNESFYRGMGNIGVENKVIPGPSTIGYFLGSRLNSDAAIYKNGTSYGSTAAATVSAAYANTAIFINSGAGNVYGRKNLSAATIGAAFTSAQASDLNTIFQTARTARATL